MNLRQRTAVSLLALFALVLTACGGTQQSPNTQTPSAGGGQQQEQQ